MSLKSLIFPSEKRKVPFNKVFKNIFRVVHVLAFGIIFGGCFHNVNYDNIFNLIIVISGILMILRENYKNGIWLVQTRGFLTVLKISLFAILFINSGSIFFVVCSISILGILSSHLPKDIRKKVWVNIK